LLKFVGELDQEDTRAVREGLDEEYLALFDLLIKKDISKKGRERIKSVAKELLDKLKSEKLNVDQWRKKNVPRLQ
jgi:type I restriction enzyme R subunit